MRVQRESIWECTEKNQSLLGLKSNIYIHIVQKLYFVQFKRIPFLISISLVFFGIRRVQSSLCLSISIRQDTYACNSRHRDRLSSESPMRHSFRIFFVSYWTSAGNLSECSPESYSAS